MALGPRRIHDQATDPKTAPCSERDAQATAGKKNIQANEASQAKRTGVLEKVKSQAKKQHVSCLFGIADHGQ